MTFCIVVANFDTKGFGNMLFMLEQVSWDVLVLCAQPILKS